MLLLVLITLQRLQFNHRASKNFNQISVHVAVDVSFAKFPFHWVLHLYLLLQQLFKDNGKQCRLRSAATESDS